MKKSSVKKLVLSRETLKNLEELPFRAVAGGEETDGCGSANTWGQSLCQPCKLK